jgi:GNAT superfamily N-acetyltransferase
MSIHVQRLSEAVRPKLREHFLRLDGEDVRLRFGSQLQAASILAYVDRIDFDNDAVLGVYDEDLGLAGVAHVAFGDDCAEMGISVLPARRGAGIGSALFLRGVEHARNRFIYRLFMHCLSENSAMMHIARKSGMKIVIDTGEADAFLYLPPADAASLAGELVGQRLALFDYTLKTQADTLRRITDALAKS